MKPSRRTVSHPQAQAPFLKPCDSQDNARTALMALAESLTFVRVVSMNVQAMNYIGEAIEVPIGSKQAASNSLHSHAEEKPKLVFVDKFGRCKGPLKVGPMTIVQCPLGPDHPSSKPSVGDLLVGTAVPNTRKSHLGFVLRGWSSDALPLWELFRMVRFGTRANEIKAREILLQMPCTLQNCPKDLASFRDELYMVARLVLYGNLRPSNVLASLENPCLKLKKPATEIEIDAAKKIKLGHSALEFVEMISMKLNSPQLLEDFMAEFDVVPTETQDISTSARPSTPPSQTFSQNSQEDAYKSFNTSLTSPAIANPTSYTNNAIPTSFTNTTSYFSQTSGYAPTEFKPSSPSFTPKSPPASPKQAPMSPVHDAEKAPASPTFELDDS